MRGQLSRRGGEKCPFPPGESISHFAEIESPGEGNISAGDSLKLSFKKPQKNLLKKVGKSINTGEWR